MTGLLLALLRWLFDAPTSADYEAASPGATHTQTGLGLGLPGVAKGR